MTTMKHIALLLALCCTLCGLRASAQTTTRWGVMAGVNMNSIHFKQSDIMTVDRGYAPKGGIMGELNIPGVGFAAEAGLLYSQRSGKLHLGDYKAWASQGLGNEMCRMHAIDVPVHLKFKYRNLRGVENTIKPMIYAGPTFSFLVGKNLRDVNQYKTVSVLLQVGVGAELFNQWQVSASYSFSVGETLRTQILDENIAKNRCWSVQAAYFFKP